ncbi:MAG: LysR family transcriptional regulator [Deltaproteobacteria bacterium]|nr:LysR family transcriptional regulator [Deltaproteobacteria bacterium]
MNHFVMNTFLALVRTQSASRTAEELNVAQSTVSKRVKLLEEEIGAVLFDRGKGNKTFTLTAAGEALVDVAERWLALWQEMQSLQSVSPKFSLSIGALDSLNYAFFPPLYQALSRHRPKINLKVVTSHSPELYDLIERREVDIAFSLLRREHPNILVEECFREPMVGLQMKPPGDAKSKWVHPCDLNPGDELFLSGGPNYQMWHDQWWDPFSSDRIRLDTSQLIFSFFFTPRQWAIVPLSVASKAEKTGHYSIFRFSEPPPDRICYQLRHRYPRASTAASIAVLDGYLKSLIAEVNPSPLTG